MPLVSSAIDIEASPEAVWKVFTDYDHYPEWNPFILELSGVSQVGDTIKVVIKPPSRSSGIKFHPVLQNYDKNAHFSWKGRLFNLPGAFTGQHHFKLHETENGTKFEQTEIFSGALATVVDWVGFGMWEDFENGFKLMNEALKQRVEDTSAPAQVPEKGV